MTEKADEISLLPPQVIDANNPHLVGSPRRAVNWLAEEEEKTTRYLCAVRFARNRIAPCIHRLPDELLELVLIEAQAACLTNSLWLHATHVCRRWRALALNLSRLWSRITVRRLDSFSAYLRRSKKCPLEISLGDEHYGVTEERIDELLALLSPHATRVVVIRLRLSSPLIHYFLHSQTVRVPKLQELHVESTTPSVVQLSPFQPPSIIPDHHALSCLSITGLLLSVDSRIFTNLRRLSLARQSGFLRENLTMPRFIQILENCPQLELLFLDEAGPLLHRGVQSYPIIPRHIELPRLNAIYMKNRAIDIGHALAYLIVPSSAQVYLEASIDQTSPSQKLTVLPRDLTHLKFLHELHRVEISGNCHLGTIELSGFSHTTSSLIRIGLQDRFLREMIPLFALETSQFISKGVLEEMVIRGDPRSLEPIAWGDVLPNLTNLVTLSVTAEYHSTDNTVAGGKQRTVTSLGKLIQALSPLYPPHVTCSALRNLELRNLVISNALLAGLYKCLQSRRKNGVNLTSLSIVGYTTYVDVESLSWPRFETLVDKFDQSRGL